VTNIGDVILEDVRLDVDLPFALENLRDPQIDPFVLAPGDEAQI
jgi:uncharacterized membrane protein